ncbi:Ovate protein family C-terminal protein [Dioscorea alata]|uniref:Ovate protein family C-terminal protein n=1 Tax=Dioscorea alata TaxID=55571 RepID=A0ACB7WKH9_DIOAL|nr:Ovate protein family C-terminal protein [Dioscorea alata]
MAEMIVEKELYEPCDLEELLHCFLSLNSLHHHSTIISAFSEIWDALFLNTTVGEQYPQAIEKGNKENARL